MPENLPIFISYRRADARNAVEELYTALVKAYGDKDVFRDTTMKPGTRYPPLLRKKLKESKTLLVVIGQHWLRAGAPGELDWVVEEVQQALRNGARIIPVLVEGASLPAKTDLPASIQPLLEWQKVSLRPEKYRLDVNKLLQYVAERPKARPITVDNLPSLEFVEKKKQHEEVVNVLTVPESGKAVVSGSEDGSVAWWRGSVAQRRPGHNSPVRALAFSQDGKTLFSLSADSLRVWTSSNSSLTTPLEFEVDAVEAMALSPRKDLFAVGLSRSDPEVWTIQEPHLVGSVPDRTLGPGLEGVYERARVGLQLPKPLWATSLAFSSDGELLAVGSVFGVVALFSADNGNLIWKRNSHKSSMTVVLAFAPVFGLLASASDQPVVVLHPLGDAPDWRVDIGCSKIAGMAFTSDGNLLACASLDGQVAFVDIQARSVLTTRINGPAFSSISFSSDDTKLALGTDRGEVQLLQIPSK